MPKPVFSKILRSFLRITLKSKKNSLVLPYFLFTFLKYFFFAKNCFVNRFLFLKNKKTLNLEIFLRLMCNSQKNSSLRIFVNTGPVAGRGLHFLRALSG